MSRHPSYNGTGLACPGCGSTASEVKDSRPAPANDVIRRRRACRCGARFTTIELIVPDRGVVVRPGIGTKALSLMSLETFIEEVLARVHESVVALALGRKA